jgi:hypothetical protein
MTKTCPGENPADDRGRREPMAMTRAYTSTTHKEVSDKRENSCGNPKASRTCMLHHLFPQ